MNVPPLVTTGSAGDIRPGALGFPGTAVLFGDESQDQSALSGLRGTVGYWFNPQHTLGVEVTGFFLEQGGDTFTATSFGTEVLARPFFDVSPDVNEVGQPFFGQSSERVSFPGVLVGSVSVATNSSFWGAEANFRSTIFWGCHWSVDFLAGFRALGLDEDLTVQEIVLDITPEKVGDTILVGDRFETENRFYGPQVGLEAELNRGRWFLNLKGKVAIGSTEQVANIFGNSVNTPAGMSSTVFDGHGLLAQPTNSGRFSRQVFTVVPEFGVNLGYNFTPHCRAHLGYNLLFWTRVARPGNQIDFSVNSNQLAPPEEGGPDRPAFSFHGSEFWAQGINLGLEFNW
jgi:hypothetical protein